MKLPVSTDQLPLEQKPWDDTVTYKGIIKAINGPKEDKNGDNYLTMEIEVTEPDEKRGRKLIDNYIGVPPEITENMTDKVREVVMERGVKLSRIAASARIATDDTDDLIGGEISFQITNREYQGRILPSIHEYLV